MNKVARTIAAIVVLGLGIGILVVYVKLSRDKREARQLILDAQRLEQDKNGSSLGGFLKKHRGFVRPTADCSELKCSYVVGLRNAPLSFLRLAPLGEFYFSVLVKQGNVQEVYVSVKTTISRRPYAAIIRDVSASTYDGSVKTLSSDAALDASGRLLTSLIQLGPMATPSDRRMAFNINIDCVFQVNGCADPSQITGGWPTRSRD